MKNVHKSVLIWYSAAEMYALVTDVPAYSRFLPWCDHALILETLPDGVRAEIGLSIAGLQQSFETRNTHEADRKVELRLVRGPFSDLHGEWRFTPVGGAGERACRVELELNYGFKNAALATAVGPVFDRIASTLVDAFVKRAEQVYT